MPLLLTPVYKEYIWGGDRFIHEFHRRLNPGIYAESWEIADHRDGSTTLLNGPHAGKTLRDVISILGTDLLGKGRTEGLFPLLVKLIDARETLSVQVHPDEVAAKRFGGEAKSEMWYVLAATPDAHIYSGFKEGVTEEGFQQALQQKTIPGLLQSFPARPGMVFSTPGGRVHAIGAGCLLLEVQQDANTTYRLYDWDRPADAATPRPLHIEQALQVINWSLTESPIARPGNVDMREGGYQSRLLLHTPHFHVEEWTVERPSEVKQDGNSFCILFPLYSAARIKAPGQPAMILPRATTCLMPAALTSFSLQPASEGNPLRILAIRHS